MTNKTDYIALINAKLPSGASIPAIDHRLTMHTDPDSILEVVYSNALGDSNGTETYTVKNTDFSYQITIFKSGNTITIFGNLIALTNLSSGFVNTVFNITDSDLYGNGIGIAKNLSNNNTYALTINSTQNKLFMSGGILSGSQVEFSITYNAIN